jgi:diguanylate cyclase (GGDEF)-like protein
MARLGVRSVLLAGFLFASGAPLAVFWLWPHSAALESELAEVRDRHLMLARTVAGSLDRYYHELRLMFGSVAPRIARGEAANLAREPLRALHFGHVCVADPKTGRVVRSFLTDEAPCPERIPEARLAMFMDLVAQGDGTLSPVMTPGDGRPPRLFIACLEGDLLVVAAIGLQRFDALARSIAFGANGHAAIVDRTGRLMAHPNPDWVEEGRYLDNVEPVRAMMEGREGVATFIAPMLEQEAIAGYAVAPNSGWGVMVPQPLSELRAKAGEDSQATLLVFLMGLGLSAVIALAVSGCVRGGVARVAGAAARMTSGEDGVRVPPGSGLCPSILEIDSLGERFNVMAERIETSRREIAAAARADELTGLLGRGAFLADAQRLIETTPESEGLTLFFVDVDRLKAINDGFGHGVGDSLLRALGRRLRAASPTDALVARQGGDEFLVLLRGADREACAAFGARILAALSRPIDLDGRRFVMSCSVGASVWPRDARHLSTLITYADRAMYEAKQTGRNKLRVFDEPLRGQVEEDEALKRALQTALAENAIGVAFQPVTDARSGQLVSFEALARWSPDGAAVSPERFVSLAEEAGLIAELGRQVRARAFAFAATLRRRGLDAPVAVNVSESEMLNLGFIGSFSEALSEAGLPASAVILEITESRFDHDLQADIPGLEALRRQGLSVALDDFGKGFSSHRRLQLYPADRLKIDIAFFGDVERDARAQAVVRNLVALGRSLDLTVTLEGVESEALQRMVERFGADESQGFWRHPPLDEAAAFALAARELQPAVAARG